LLSILCKKIMPLLALCLLALSSCTREVTFLELHPEEELNQINNISILDGGSGNKVYSQDGELIRRFTGWLSQLQLQTYRNHDEYDGYQYGIAFFKDDQMIFAVTPYGNRISIDGNYYTVLNPEICQEFVALVAEQYS